MSTSNKNDGLTRRHLIIGTGAALGAATLGAGTAEARDKKKKRKKKAKEDLPQVPRRVLGKTGKTIPILLLGGAVDLDPKFDPKIAEGLRYGVNYIDAAESYGGHT